MDIYEYLSGQLQNEIKAIGDDLMRGQAKDYADYKFHAGIVWGMMKANGHIMDAKAMVERDDD